MIFVGYLCLPREDLPRQPVAPQRLVQSVNRVKNISQHISQTEGAEETYSAKSAASNMTYFNSSI